MRGAELLGLLGVFAVGEPLGQGPPMDKDLQCLSQGRDRDNEDHRGEQHPVLHGHAQTVISPVSKSEYSPMPWVLRALDVPSAQNFQDRT